MASSMNRLVTATLVLSTHLVIAAGCQSLCLMNAGRSPAKIQACNDKYYIKTLTRNTERAVDELSLDYINNWYRDTVNSSGRRISPSRTAKVKCEEIIDQAAQRIVPAAVAQLPSVPIDGPTPEARARESAEFYQGTVEHFGSYTKTAEFKEWSEQYLAERIAILDQIHHLHSQAINTASLDETTKMLNQWIVFREDRESELSTSLFRRLHHYNVIAKQEREDRFVVGALGAFIIMHQGLNDDE